MATQTVFLTGNETYTGNPLSDDFNVTDDNVGSNTLTLGSGIDLVTLNDAGSNTVVLGDGNDQVTAEGAGSSNTLTVGNGNNQVTVTGGSNTITVGTGINAIALGAGSSNTLSTGAGNNTVTVAGTAVSGDTIHGAVTSNDGTTNHLVLTNPGTMNPAAVYGFQSYQLANGGANSLTLSDGNFVNLPGGSITVIGGNAGNTVNAASLSSAHSVVIDAGSGLDALTGGGGADRFIFAASDLSADTVNGGAGLNTLELGTGSGMGTVNGLGVNFSNLGVIDVDPAANWLFTSVAAVTDTINLAAGATAEFSGAISSGQTIAFTGASATLKIDSATQFAGQIDGLQTGDKIDLTGVAFSAAGTATLGAGNVLQVAENGQTYSLNLNPNQDFSGLHFDLTSDGNTGTYITMSVSGPPTVTPHNQTVAYNQSVGLSTIFTLSGPAATAYQVFLVGPNDGMVTDGNGAIATNTVVDEASLSGINFVGGVNAGTDQLYLRAFDGQWSAWAPSQATLTDPGAPHAASVGFSDGTGTRNPLTVDTNTHDPARTSSANSGWGTLITPGDASAFLLKDATHINSGIFG